MVKLAITGFLLTGAVALAPAQAQSSLAETPSSAETDALRAEIAELKARLATLEAKVDENAAQGDVAASPAAAAATAPAPPENITWKGAPRFSNADGWSFKPRGRLVYDAAYVGSPDGVRDPGLGFSNELRRARLGMEGSIPGGFGYKLELEFADGSPLFTDAYLDYGKGALTITVGQHNNFQSLEELTSANDTSFIERAAFTDAFDFEYRVGVSAQYERGPIIAQAGVFTAAVEDLFDDATDAVGVDGRLVYAPKLGGTQLHFAGSLHYRDQGTTLQSIRYRQRPLVHSTDVRFIGTPTLTASDTFGYGLEAAAISGRFHAAGEAFWQHADQVTGYDPTFFGTAIEAGYFFTDDTRGYKGGVFKGVKVSDPVSAGGIGAVQGNIRYDRLDLTDGPIAGGTQDGYELSLIWTPIDYVRFLVNYGHLVYRDVAIPAVGGDRNYAVDAVGARAQIAF